jgi:hypothetical protein
MKKVLTTLCASVALLGVSLPAAAVIDSWDTVSGASGCGWSGTNCAWGNVRSYTSDNGQNNVSASAWSNTVGTSNTNIDDAYLAVYGSNGLGVVNQDAANGTDSNEAYNDYPEHAMDNNERFDSILFSFDQAIKLTTVDIGYRNTDADISVLAYTGGATLPTNLDSYFNGLSYSALISNGWTLIGNFANLSLGSNSVQSPSSVYSSYWLVGAYNSAFGSGSGLGAGNDYMKIAGLAGERQSQCNGGGCGGGSVPEPSSLVMAGLAVALALSAMQRRAQSRL